MRESIRKRASYWGRWLLVGPAAVLGLCLAWAFESGVYHMLASLGVRTIGIPARAVLLQSAAGFLGGLLWVLCAALTAPGKRLPAAVVSFLLGAVVSYSLAGIVAGDSGVWLGSYWYPMLASLCGGGLAVAAVASRSPSVGVAPRAAMAVALPLLFAAVALVRSIPSGPFGGGPITMILTDAQGDTQRVPLRATSGMYETSEGEWVGAGLEGEWARWTWAPRNAPLLEDLAGATRVEIDGDSGAIHPVCAAPDDSLDTRRHVEGLLRRRHQQRWGSPPRKTGIPVPEPDLEGYVPIRITARSNCAASIP